jgi:hypothetical protein
MRESYLPLKERAILANTEPRTAMEHIGHISDAIVLILAVYELYTKHYMLTFLVFTLPVAILAWRWRKHLESLWRRLI